MRRFEPLLFLPWALGTLMFSIHIVGAKLFLICVYGWGRVLNEHLRILKMSKREPWLISNGDRLAEGHFVHFLISGACWLLLFLATYPLIRLLLPKAIRTPSR
jgi:hypothetical protein